MGTGMTERDAQAVAFLVGRLREETYGANTWDPAGIWAELKPLVGQNLDITLERVLRHAADPEAKTPGSIRRPFLPPAASAKPAAKRGNPHRDEECPKHPGQWPDTCGPCKVERYGGDGSQLKPRVTPGECYVCRTRPGTCPLHKAAS